jgi:hypothetical protein
MTVLEIHRSSHADFGLAQASADGWSVDDWLTHMRGAGFLARAVDLGGGARQVARISRTPGQRLERARALTQSAVFTLAYWVRGRCIPSLRREARKYEERLRRHRQDGQHIEPFLFILDKPAAR